ncbi:hypothetical protein ACFVTF_07695 [Kitasatospora sp. NPDC057940]|uniref:hypothetical protein n=1 Tax=Kitasatospora sp. NPDC057940 TaxID=3346285 RepID=UPI0036DC303C
MANHPDAHPDETADEECGDGTGTSFEDLADLLSAGDRTGPVIYAPYGNINTGAVHGDQRVLNGHAAHHEDRHAHVRSGPIPPAELADAQSGFAEPDWFAGALASPGARLFFLTGRPGTGRRTAAVNLLLRLLLRRGRPGSALWSVDGDTDLSSWRPHRGEAGGYLLDDRQAPRSLRLSTVHHLQQSLESADAYLVIVVPDSPELVRGLEHQLRVGPLRHQPPVPEVVFATRFAAAVPDPDERDRLLKGLAPGLLDTVLVPELVPAEVAELATAVATSAGKSLTLGSLHERLVLLADSEAPRIVAELRANPHALAFLLAVCVFEGLDHRLVQEQAERLLGILDGALRTVPGNGDDGSPQFYADPRLALAWPWEELLHIVRAERMPPEIRTGPPHPRTLEPVRFTRHRQGEAVLRHVWREYSGLAAALTTWLEHVADTAELTAAAGRALGLAAGCGLGPQAFRRIGALAASERGADRAIAAHALSAAAADPALAEQVESLLNRLSRSHDPRRRSTVAHVCDTSFGRSRPDRAMELLLRVAQGPVGEPSLLVQRAVRPSVVNLFTSGGQPTVVRHLASRLRQSEADAESALRLFPHLLADLLTEASWFQQEILAEGACMRPVVELIRRSLDHDGVFDLTCRHLVRWCRLAPTGPRSRAVDILFRELARHQGRGTRRLSTALAPNSGLLSADPRSDSGTPRGT